MEKKEAKEIVLQFMDEVKTHYAEMKPEYKAVGCSHCGMNPTKLLDVRDALLELITLSSKD